MPAEEAFEEAACRAAIAAGDIVAWFHLGLVLSEQPGREVEAEPAYRRAIAVAPGDGDAWASLGWVLAGQPAVVKRLQRPGGRTRDPER